VDDIIPEPLGGAHNDPSATAQTLKRHLLKHLKQLHKQSTTDRLKLRYEKFRSYGRVLEKQPAAA
jgi:acetyl-CoA carboxylase carboxyl transferase subunit alpha